MEKARSRKKTYSSIQATLYSNFLFMYSWEYQTKMEGPDPEGVRMTLQKKAVSGSERSQRAMGSAPSQPETLAQLTRVRVDPQGSGGDPDSRRRRPVEAQARCKIPGRPAGRATRRWSFATPQASPAPTCGSGPRSQNRSSRSARCGTPSRSIWSRRRGSSFRTSWQPRDSVVELFNKTHPLI